MEGVFCFHVPHSALVPNLVAQLGTSCPVATDESMPLCQHAVLVLDASGGDGSGCSLVVVSSALVLCLFDGEGGGVSCSEVFCLIGVVAG